MVLQAVMIYLSIGAVLAVLVGLMLRVGGKPFDWIEGLLCLFLWPLILLVAYRAMRKAVDDAIEKQERES